MVTTLYHNNILTLSFMFKINTLCGHLLIINVLIWIATAFALPRLPIETDSYNTLSLHYWQSADFNALQFVSYMFLHSNNNFFHIFFNMWSLVLFGGMLESAMGQKKFLTFYLVCGIGAALVQELTWSISIMPEFNEMHAILENGEPFNVRTHEGIVLIKNFDELRSLYNPITTVGASGAVFGLLVAFGMLFPERELFLMFIPVPIKAKYMTIGYIVIELFFGVKDFQGDNIAHYAHLGGALFGFLLIYYWKKRGDLTTYM